MMLLSLILLGLVLDKCCGQTQIIYTTKKKESITCETKKWQISTDSNNIIDLNCTEVPKLLSVYIAVPVLLCVLLVVVVVFIKKRRMISQGSQSAQKSCHSREDNLYTDCSPYAIGTGEEEHHFAPKKESSRMLDPGCKGSTPALDPYSVVRLNSLYE
ncbi:uncharacterized protein [Hoplias malabaricus]|uniref:uncharacterized protein isoform X3 n=1 Tax=Hoplias malabaricus TaxID=27720 RepID=UPI0034635EBA